MTFLPASASSQKAAMGTDFLGSARDLDRYIAALPIDNPKTSELVIVTLYTTASTQFLCLFMQAKDSQRYYISKLSLLECHELEIKPNKYNDQQFEANCMKLEGQGDKKYELCVNTSFIGTGIWDKVYWLKNINT